MTKRFKNRMWVGMITMALLVAGCGNNPTDGGGGGVGGGEVSDYLRGLQYDSEALLNVQDTGSSDNLRTIGDADTSISQVGNFQQSCVRTNYNLKQNFDKVAILRPTQGIVFPGALVKANQSLMDGLPEPIGLPRAPMQLSVNLPGMGQNGVLEVDQPTIATVTAAIDEALQWWNNNAYQEGYVNPANSSFEFTTAYSSEQLSLDVGLNVAWAGGEVNSQFDFFTNEQKWVSMAVYKQGFYTVDFTTPTSPEAVFSENVDLTDVQNTLSGADAPAYVSSVTYGRIIMMRMETNTSIQTTSANVESALKYAAGVDVDGSLESEYQRILNNSSLEVVTIGGNASVASRLVTLNGTEGQLESVIQDTNAVYSINNPGVPIAYSVFHLKDNSLAKLGYTTDYTATECVQVRNKNTVKITMDEFYVIGDCDTGPGDFYLYGSTGKNGARQGFSEIGSDSWSGAVEVSSGEAKALDNEYIFTVNRVEGEEFYVYFYSPEWDNPAFGDPRHDPDMNPKSITKTFRFSSGEWTNIPTDPNVPQYLTTGSGNCSARLQYKVEVY